MKKRALFCNLCILGIALTLSGCSASSRKETTDAWTSDGSITVGHSLTITNSGSGLSLLDNIDVLSADGLYYAAFTMGDSEPYENSDGDTVDLYDAQLYLVLGEYSDSANAQDNLEKWLTAARNNYELQNEEEITCNGQAYTLLTYRFANASNPYDRGVSAFGIRENSAVCIELTCREHFGEDLTAILTDFLENCTYHTGE